jgi:1-acyl-sn-glycerol-3-phosphate acyltransferase
MEINHSANKFGIVPHFGLNYHMFRLIGKIFSLPLNWQLIGKENIPKNGPVIIVPNHVSPIDPPIIFSLMPRKCYIMTKSEYFYPQLGPLNKSEYLAFKYIGRHMLPRLGAFPIKRGKPDRRNLITALSALENNELLAIFPEGRISPTKYLQINKGGAAWLAYAQKASIVPIYIIGTGAKWPNYPEYKGCVKVYCGYPIYPHQFPTKYEDNKNRRILTGIIEDRMKELGKLAWLNSIFIPN